MTEAEFISKTIGKPWVNRASSFDKMDCYGLVMLYKKHVQGLDLPIVFGYESGHDFDELWSRETKSVWNELKGWANGAMVTFFNAAGRPKHVGICIGQRKVLHCRGFIDSPGKVEIHNIAALERAFKSVKYHELKNA